MPTADELQMYVKIGETLYPLAVAGVEAIKAIIATHNGNTNVIAQLEANRVTIDADKQTIADELKALDEGGVQQP